LNFCFFTALFCFIFGVAAVLVAVGLLFGGVGGELLRPLWPFLLLCKEESSQRAEFERFDDIQWPLVVEDYKTLDDWLSFVVSKS
jgi:hypothetical protein